MDLDIGIDWFNAKWTIDDRPKRKKLTDTVKNHVMKQQHYKCLICHKELPARKHFHHVIPISKGGGNLPDNIIAVCSNCHDEITHQMQLDEQKKKQKPKKEKDIFEQVSDDLDKIGL